MNNLLGLLVNMFLRRSPRTRNAGAEMCPLRLFFKVTVPVPTPANSA